MRCGKKLVDFGEIWFDYKEKKRTWVNVRLFHLASTDDVWDRNVWAEKEYDCIDNMPVPCCYVSILPST